MRGMNDSLHVNTPLLESLPLSRCAGRKVWLKMDALQPSGSFKTRGIGFACQRYRERGCNRFVASSGGNAGLAVAYAGRRLSTPVTVVVPESTSARARELIAEQSAELVVYGQSWQEAHEHALSLLEEDVAYIHPFDDPLIWEGHASIVDEVLAEGPEPDAFVLSVGGGGLFCGVASGLLAAGRPNTSIVAAETEGAESFHKTLQAGELVALDRISSVATSLGAKQVAARALEFSRQLPVTATVVSDRDAVEACLKFADDHRLVVEPACGAALALAYQNAAALGDSDQIVIVVCGGAGVTYNKLLELRQQCAEK